MKKILAFAMMGALFAGCSKETTGTGSAPQAETKVEIDLDDTRDSLRRAAKDAERKIESGTREARAKLEDAGDTLKEKFEDAKDRLDNDKDAKVKIEVKKD